MKTAKSLLWSVMLVAVLGVMGCMPNTVITFPADDAEFTVGELIEFTGIMINQSGTPTVEWEWDFGDGNIETTETGTAYHSYEDPGVYVVSLTVTNEDGDSSICVSGTGCEVTLVANSTPCTSAVGTDCKGRITVDDMKVRYWRNYALGTSNAAIRRAVIVQHGNTRNADDYFGYIVEAATTEDHIKSTLILAPNFITTDDAPLQDELYWSSAGWKKGNLSQNEPEMSSFEVMDRIFEKLSEPGKFPNLEKVVLVGHSAGGQFINRFAGGSEAEDEPDMSGIPVKYIVANPSSYLYLNESRRVSGFLDQFEVPDDTDCPAYNEYKFGLEDRNTYMSQVTGTEIITQYTARDVTYFLGTDDNDPNDSSMATECEDMLQGDHRLERGEIFYNYLCQFFDCSNHQLEYAESVNHDGHDMFNSDEGRELIFE